MKTVKNVFWTDYYPEDARGTWCVRTVPYTNTVALLFYVNDRFTALGIEGLEYAEEIKNRIDLGFLKTYYEFVKCYEKNGNDSFEGLPYKEWDDAVHKYIELTKGDTL